MLELSSTPTSALADSDRRGCLEFVTRLHGTTRADYLARRLERYPSLHTACSAAGLVALMLTDTAQWNGVDLHYVGPVFSTRRGYLALFSRWVESLCLRERPFCVVAEVESGRVLSDMGLLLPRWIHPGRDARSVLPEVRLAALATEAAFSHVEGLDLTTLTTRTVEPLSPGVARVTASRYQLLLLPCFGRLFAPAELRSDLARGFSHLRPRHARTSTADLLCSGS